MAATSKRRIIIGDVHGHYDGLVALLENISPVEGDEVHFLGDLIDRGPRSADVVELVCHNGYSCLLGNHEHMLLQSFPENGQSDALQPWLYSGGNATIASYKDWDQLLKHIQWIKTLPLYRDLGDAWLVHAGLHPALPIARQTTQELCWIREEFHSIPRPYFADKLILIGHTITFTLPGVKPGELAQGHGWLGIDTGAYHPRSGWLTALDIDNWKVYQVNVFQRRLRILPFEEVVARIDLSQLTEGQPTRLTPVSRSDSSESLQSSRQPA
ncbi:MAG: serine/threonine protein phosphatase [Synechococcales cyanobacterium RU_4_20]|nr:serine/threonine protein phosphatase [Synechococcales cyanobacterium RU_4_20]NJR67524.1 serine/threonine protein phosphatase [Synechococcales cyanobacterium CRU_2_2]